MARKAPKRVNRRKVVEALLRRDFQKSIGSRIEAEVKERTPELREEIAHDLRRHFDDEVERRLQKALHALRIETRRRLTETFEEVNLPAQIAEGLKIFDSKA
jgi:hypothetical protein